MPRRAEKHPTAPELVRNLTEEEADLLRNWARLHDRHSVAIGGRGQTAEEYRAAAAAWDALKSGTQLTQQAMVACLARDVAQARREAFLHGIPEVATLKDAAALLGDDYPLWDFLTAAQVSAAGEH